MAGRVEGIGHMLLMDNFLSSQDLSDDLHTRYQLWDYQTARGCDSKTLELKWHNIHPRLGNNMTAVLQDRQNVHILMNICRPPAEGKFRDEHRKAQKPVIVTDYIHSAHGLC